MAILIGTREGVFVFEGSGAPKAAEGLNDRGVLTLCRVNGSILAGTDDGVYRSNDARDWQASGCEGRAIRAIAAAPDNAMVYAGTQPAALYRSGDGGCSWDELKSLTRVPGSGEWGLPGDPSASRALAIVIDAAQPAHCWVGVEVGGVMETQDGGATWRANLVDQNPDIHMLVRDPGRKDVLFATTGFGRVGPGSLPEEQSKAGAYRSNDAGRTWSYVWPDLEHRYTRPMVIDSRAPHALTVASAPNFRSSYRDEGGAQSMLYQSKDGGETWRSLGDAAHSPSAANLTALVPGDEAGSVLVGTDSGELWQVSARAEWTLLAGGLPYVQALLTLD
jgi:photosystem II stability/assembly factor-like uncharacterized protein